MAYAVVRIRGGINARREVKDTLKMLNLTRVNHCVIVPEDETYKGMLRVVKDYVTWGEVTPEIAARLIVMNGRLRGGERITDAYVKKNTKYSSILAFSKAVCAGGTRYRDLPDAAPMFRLPPPRKGYEGIKRSYKNKGAAGYRGKDIIPLLERMLPPPPKAKKGKEKTKPAAGKKKETQEKGQVKKKKKEEADDKEEKRNREE